MFRSRWSNVRLAKIATCVGLSKPSSLARKRPEIGPNARQLPRNASAPCLAGLQHRASPGDPLLDKWICRQMRSCENSAPGSELRPRRSTRRAAPADPHRSSRHPSLKQDARPRIRVAGLDEIIGDEAADHLDHRYTRRMPSGHCPGGRRDTKMTHRESSAVTASNTIRQIWMVDDGQRVTREIAERLGR
jgi:hypothetical protein